MFSLFNLTTWSWLAVVRGTVRASNHTDSSLSTCKLSHTGARRSQRVCLLLVCDVLRHHLPASSSQPKQLGTIYSTTLNHLHSVATDDIVNLHLICDLSRHEDPNRQPDRTSPTPLNSEAVKYHRITQKMQNERQDVVTTLWLESINQPVAPDCTVQRWPRREQCKFRSLAAEPLVLHVWASGWEICSGQCRTISRRLFAALNQLKEP